MNRLRLSVILLLVVATLAAYRFRPPSPPPLPDYVTYDLERGDILLAVNATGTIEPLRVVDVGAQIIGMIKEFGPDPADPTKPLDFGAQVTKGGVLARIDDATYQVELAKAQANLKLAEAEVRRGQAQLAAAENDWKRTQRLKHTTTQTEYDHALAGFDVAQADLAANQARLEQAYVAERLARINLDYTVIRSPIDGLVIDRRVDVGQTVVSGLNTPSLFLLASDLARMRIRAAVNEADISKVRLGQKVYFSVDAYPEQRLAGVVTQVRLNASITNNVVTYDVVIDIDNPNGQLLPYMTASLRFVIDERQGVFKAPAEALHWQPEGEVPAPVISGAATRSLWHLEAGMARPIEITPGLTDGAFIEVQGDGLRPGLSLIVGRQQRSAADFGSTILKSILGG